MIPEGDKVLLHLMGSRLYPAPGNAAPMQGLQSMQTQTARNHRTLRNQTSRVSCSGFLRALGLMVESKRVSCLSASLLWDVSEHRTKKGHVQVPALGPPRLCDLGKPLTFQALYLYIYKMKTRAPSTKYV